MTLQLHDILVATIRCGIALSSTGGGTYLLIATEDQLKEFARKCAGLLSPDALERYGQTDTPPQEPQAPAPRQWTALDTTGAAEAAGLPKLPEKLTWTMLDRFAQAVVATFKGETPSAEAQAEPVARVIRNEAGQIYIEWCDGKTPLDFVGASLYVATTPAPAQADMSSAARDVLAERRRQVEAEGWTPEHDDEHDDGDIACAASAYALAAADALNPFSQGDGDFKTTPPGMWPWDYRWWKPGDPRRMLVKACALGLAEIERLDRAALKESQQ